MNNLTTLYKQRLNLQKATFSHIDHSDAMVAIVYKVTKANGTQSILKICTRTEDYLREIYFLEYFSGKLPVPDIIQLVPPEKDLDGAILMEYLPGTLLSKKDLTPTVAHEIGSLLARIHQNRVSKYGDLTKPNELSPDPRIPFTQKFEEGLSECNNHLPKPLMDKCKYFYDTHIHFLTSVDGPCIIHRDFRPGNVIIDNGKVQGIIDWAGGRASFAEEDLCPMELGEWPFNSDNKKAFLTGYSSIRPIPNYGNIIPILQLSRVIAIIGFSIKRRTWNSSNAQVYQVNREFLEAFLKENSHN